MTLTATQKVKGGAKPNTASNAEIEKLPMVVQVLLKQIGKASPSDRREIHGRLANYLGDFSQHDVPASATKALNEKLASYGLPAVTAPPSATVAAFRRLVERELNVTTIHSSHTGRDEPIDPSHLHARHRVIHAVTQKVASLGASLTREELSDAARILELAVRSA